MNTFKFLPEGWEKDDFTVTEDIYQGIVDKCDSNYNLHVKLDSGLAGIIPRKEVEVFNLDENGFPKTNLCVGKVHKYVQFKIKEKEGDNFILSRKDKKKEVLNSVKTDLKEGQVVNGIVKNITSYGAFVDIGGGFFGGQVVPGKPIMEDYANAVLPTLSKVLDMKKVKLIIEPGSSVISTAVDYLMKVLNVRDIRGVKIVTTDGSDLDMNPFRFDREPKRIDFDRTKTREVEGKQVIAGATCMENDIIFIEENKPAYQKDDYIFCRYIGGYSISFNNHFINDPPGVFRIDY